MRKDSNLLLAKSIQKIMKKSIEISKETVTVIESGKIAVGQLFIDKISGKLTFKKFNRNKRKKDTVIMDFESGWLKESQTRVKFYSSVKKTVGARRIRRAMDRDFTAGMDAMETYFASCGKEDR
jgi:hypothetical protein